MMKTITNIKYWLYGFCTVFLVVLIFISAITPALLLNNKFLANFINHELLNVLAVTTSVTMAWSGHLVIQLHSLEDSIDGLKFKKTIGTLKRNIIFLGCYFILSLIFLMVESGIYCSPIIRASVYSILLTILLMNIITMIQTHLLSFKIPTIKEINRMVDQDDNS